MWGYRGTAQKQGGQGDVLAPFPGRIKDATYEWQGQRHSLAANDKDGPNAIHGFVRAKAWEQDEEEAPNDVGAEGVVAGMPSSARFSTTLAPGDHEGYPFHVELAVGYEVGPHGFTSAYVAHNLGTTPAPFGIGFHPYLATGPVEQAALQVWARQLVEFERLVPTGRLVPVPPELDFRRGRPIGPTRLNHCFTDLARDEHGLATVHVGPMRVWMDPAFSHLVLYTGDALGPGARRSLAVEPMTCATDAFNHPEWGDVALQPGEVRAGRWGIRFT